MISNQKAYALLHMIIGETRRLLFKTKYYAEVDVTDNCNLRCKHCYHFSNPHKILHPEEVPLETWKERLSRLYGEGVRFMLLGGGEPALRLDVVELAYRTFPVVNIVTNGQIPIPKKLSRLLLFVSLDGDRVKNDAVRGKNTFDQVIRNYSGDSRVIINMTLLKDNYTDLESVVKEAKQNAFRGVVCNFYTNIPDYADPLFIAQKERADIIAEVRRVKKIYPSHLLLTKSMIDWYAKPDHRGYCYWGDEVLHFDVSWERRRCFSSPSARARAGCANCGCFAGSFQNPLSLLRYVREAYKLV